MKRIPIFLAVLFFAFAAGDSSGKTVGYPEEESVISIAFPDAWEVESGEYLLYAAPADGAIYFGLWALEDVESAEEALKSIEEIVGDLVLDLKVGKAQKATINSIPFLMADGKAKDEEEKTVEVSIALFSPKDKTVFILIHFGSAEAEKNHKAELTGIVNSIKRHNGK